ncbi:MAG TPA: hypothetical protein VGC66_13790 [Pyrinomonadaceae bacterium]|jgi:hypothetical protein
MSGRDYITCTNCSRNIVPRLWHATYLGVTRTQHLCSFCGAVLFVTGPRGVGAAIIALLYLALRLIDIGTGGGGRRRRRV